MIVQSAMDWMAYLDINTSIHHLLVKRIGYISNRYRLKLRIGWVG